MKQQRGEGGQKNEPDAEFPFLLHLLHHHHDHHDHPSSYYYCYYYRLLTHSGGKVSPKIRLRLVDVSSNYLPCHRLGPRRRHPRQCPRPHLPHSRPNDSTLYPGLGSGLGSGPDRGLGSLIHDVVDDSDQALP